MSISVKPDKTVLDDTEIALLLEGLGALYREFARMAADAYRLGYPAESAALAGEARRVEALLSVANSVTINKITVRHSHY